ncbi:MAG: hypothetical protein EBU14_12965 [Acetobacteraceae bacterium]|nr:hypothetical protein [Acetobacteraceae bacterium]
MRIMALKEKLPALLGLTTQIVTAHLSHNKLSAAELPDFIRSIHESLAQIAIIDCKNPLEGACFPSAKGRLVH